ncbi:AB-hydrolase YheT [Clavulina sp. PMI_390]|nr:AB-hydrolase YheT [Clavulina sp. PMI_390]
MTWTDKETEELTIKEIIETRVPSALSPFSPSWWLPNGHAQTGYVVAGNFEDMDRIVYERTLIRTPEGATLGIDMTPPSKESANLPANTPIVVVQHGLTGGSYEPYVRSILGTATAPKSSGGLGLRAFVINFRGCAGVPITSPRLYSAQNTDDLRSGLMYITSKFPDAPLLGLGFSLGANIITRYLGEEGVKSRLRSGLVLACPWDMKKNSDRLRSTFIGRKVYSAGMGAALFALFESHVHEWRAMPDDPIMTPLIPKVLAMKNPTLKQFDQAVVCAVGGRRAPFPFKTADDYYIDSSSHKSLPSIRVPFLGISAHDDPIVRSYPTEHTPLSTSCALIVTAHGGHLGWFTGGSPIGSAPPPDRWVRGPALEWLRVCAEEMADAQTKPSNAQQQLEERNWVGRGEVGLGKDRVESGGFVVDLEKDWVGFKVVEEGIVFMGVKKEDNLSAGI